MTNTEELANLLTPEIIANPNTSSSSASSSSASSSSTMIQPMLTREEEGCLVIFRVWVALQIERIGIAESAVPILIPLVKMLELGSQVFAARIHSHIYQAYDNILPLFIPSMATIKTAFNYLSQRIRTIEDISIFMEQLFAQLAPLTKYVDAIESITMYSSKTGFIKKLLDFYKKSTLIEPMNFRRLLDRMSEDIMSKIYYCFRGVDEAYGYIIINRLTDKFGFLNYTREGVNFANRRLPYITAALKNPLNAITHIKIGIDGLYVKKPDREITQFAEALLHRYCELERLTLTWSHNYYDDIAHAIIAALSPILTQVSCPLRRLHLEDTDDETIGESALVALAKALPESQLTHLILKAPALSEITMDAMAKAMTNAACPLKVWALRLREISNENIGAIAAVLTSEQHQLSHLITQAHRWGEHGAGLIAITQILASPSCYLRRWTLATRELTSLHIDAITTMMTSPTCHLEDFTLFTSTALGERGMTPFAAALTHPNCHLKNWFLVFRYDGPQLYYQLLDTDIQAIVQAATAPNGPESLRFSFLAVNCIDWLTEVLLHTHCKLAYIALRFDHPNPITALDALIRALRINNSLIDLYIKYNLGALPFNANEEDQGMRHQLKAEIKVKTEQLCQLIEKNRHNKLLQSLNLQQLAWLKARSSGEDLTLLPATISVGFSKFQAKAMKHWGIFNKMGEISSYPIATFPSATLEGPRVEASKPTPCL